MVAAVAGADRAVGEVLLAELVLGHGHPVQAARARLGQGQGAAQVSREQLQRGVVSYTYSSTKMKGCSVGFLYFDIFW